MNICFSRCSTPQPPPKGEIEVGARPPKGEIEVGARPPEGEIEVGARPPKGEIEVGAPPPKGEIGREKFFAKRRISPFGGGWGVEHARHKSLILFQMQKLSKNQKHLFIYSFTHFYPTIPNLSKRSKLRLLLSYIHCLLHRKLDNWQRH